MAGPFDNLPPEVALEQQRLTRQQQLANALMQNNQQPQGQMVSGRFVAPSFFQNLQPVANMLTGAYLSNKADERSQALAQQLRKREGELVNKYMTSITPVSAQEGGIVGPDGKLTMQTTADMYGPDMTLNPAYRQVAPVEGRKADYKTAFEAAMDPSKIDFVSDEINIGSAGVQTNAPWTPMFNNESNKIYLLSINYSNNFLCIFYKNIQYKNQNFFRYVTDISMITFASLSFS
jgi:hypothetical protein